LEEDIIDEEKI